jgi:hypothetical protein
LAIKLVSIEVQRSGSMLRSSSCVPHGGSRPRFAPPSIVQAAPVAGSRNLDIADAFGHGHVGMASSGMTGMVLSDLVASRF